MSKILVADEEQFIRELLSLELSEAGYQVFTAGSCHKLMQKIGIIQPDLVVLESQVGEFDGLEILQEIRDCQADLPVVMYSSDESKKYDLRAIAADYYVIKSYDLTELKAKIAHAIEARTPVLVPPP